MSAYILPLVGDLIHSEFVSPSGPKYGMKDPSPGTISRSTSGSVDGAERGRQQKCIRSKQSALSDVAGHGSARINTIFGVEIDVALTW